MDTLQELRAVAKRRRVHFDIRPDFTYRDHRPTAVGFEVRVWGVHEKGSHALPGCERCRPILEELEQVARWALPPEEPPTRLEVVPCDRSLYDSKVLPGADEVYVAIRVEHRGSSELPVDACEDRCLRAIRLRLRELGIAES